MFDRDNNYSSMCSVGLSCHAFRQNSLKKVSQNKHFYTILDHEKVDSCNSQFRWNTVDAEKAMAIFQANKHFEEDKYNSVVFENLYLDKYFDYQNIGNIVQLNNYNNNRLN